MLLHWLPVKARIDYKIAVICFNTINNPSAPVYLKDLINAYTPNRSLRSAGKNLLSTRKTKLKTFGDRSFEKYGPTIWNSLPEPLTLRSMTSVDSFKKNLKTFLFRKHLLDDN